MEDTGRRQRREAILDIAAELLTERGYRNTSMLDIASRAGASKETLYAWFGDKQGLFEAVVRRNAQKVEAVLSQRLDGGGGVEELLRDFGQALLSLLLGERAIAINRAAIAEATADGRLGRLLAAAGRDTTLPLFVAFLERQDDAGALMLEDATEAAELFVGLLTTDGQVRRLLGVEGPPSEAEIARRAERATRLFLRLYGAPVQG